MIRIAICKLEAPAKFVIISIMDGEITKNSMLSETVQTLLAVIDAGGIQSRTYYKRMAGLCVGFCQKIECPPDETEHIRLAALLHDIGMIATTGRRGHHTDPLSDASSEIRLHPVASERILSNLTSFRPILPIVRHHHEHFDGSGYPDGLSGDRIPRGARILHIVEQFMALAMEGADSAPERNVKIIFEKMQQASGTRYDPELLKTFTALKGESPSRPNVASRTTTTPSSLEIARIILDDIKSNRIQLPSLPDNIQAIQQAISDPDTTSGTLVDLISKDAKLSIQLIATANSSFYAGKMKIRSIHEAVTRIGLQETQNVVSTLLTRRFYKMQTEAYQTLLAQLWQHSLACAYAARAIADHLAYSNVEKYFLMGIVHDIGKVIILQAIHNNRSWREQLDFPQILAIMQRGHNSIGAIFLRRGKFPKEFFEMATSHDESRLYATTAKSTLIISLANHIAHSIGYGNADGHQNVSESDAAIRLKIDADTVAGIGETVKQKMADTSSD